MSKKILSFIVSILLFTTLAKAQSAEVSITLNEQFFNSFLDAVFTNLKEPSFPLSQNQQKQSDSASLLSLNESNANQRCNDEIILKREIGGVRTAVRFVDGKIYAPIAFSGTYSLPFVGCLPFQGWAETTINLDYDRDKQTLFGRAKVTNVQLQGVPSATSGLLVRMVQNSIDRKINPVEILKTEQVAFVVPIQQANGSLRLKATDMKTEVMQGAVNVKIIYEFVKAE
jgi:hypothetical protein